MVKIRLSRIGAKGQPYYRVVVVDERKKRDGAVLETIGRYNPRTEPLTFEIDRERLKYWRGVGAQPTEPVLVLLGEAKPKFHKPREKKEEAPTAAPAAPAPGAEQATNEVTPTEGAAEVKTDAPETTPEASPELAEAVKASEEAHGEVTPEVVAETIERTEKFETEEAAAQQNQPQSGEVAAAEAEEASETDNSDEAPQPA